MLNMSLNIIEDSNKNININNDNEIESKKIIKKRNKLTKKQQFKNERNNIIDNLNNFIGINENNNCFFLYELEKKKILKNIYLIILMI